MKFDFTDAEFETAIAALAVQLGKYMLPREETMQREFLKPQEFMLMAEGPCGASTEDWWHFKHRVSRNYVYVRIRDPRLWVPGLLHENDAHFFHRGAF